MKREKEGFFWIDGDWRPGRIISANKDSVLAQLRDAQHILFILPISDFLTPEEMEKIGEFWSSFLL